MWYSMDPGMMREIAIDQIKDMTRDAEAFRLARACHTREPEGNLGQAVQALRKLVGGRRPSSAPASG